ncbi:DedA family protein [Auritidibacter ignavus]|uniref:DedA family protein n=1 Tax=Auritidibacter ignavus TaxID=678932 RepID=UPI0024B98A44|nr:DedA family protein [Auritidibacter ignavus]WHS35363.1 DedA family protein [Auritidibacter ignavus]
MLQELMATQANSADSAFGLIGDWAVAVMNALGPTGVGLLVLIENLFPPIPSEVILPLAGFSAASDQAQFTWTSAVLFATVGSVLGAYCLYGLGAWLGHQHTVNLLTKLPLVERREIGATINWFNKHGYWTVFLGRMVPIFRSLISLPAGVERMNWWRFGLLTLTGSAIWNTIFVYGGFLLGENWYLLEQAAGWFQYLVIGLLLLALITYVVYKIRSRKTAQRPGAAQLD